MKLQTLFLTLLLGVSMMPLGAFERPRIGQLVIKQPPTQVPATQPAAQLPEKQQVAPPPISEALARGSKLALDRLGTGYYIHFLSKNSNPDCGEAVDVYVGFDQNSMPDYLKAQGFTD